MPSKLEKAKFDRYRQGFVQAADAGVSDTADEVKEDRDGLVHVDTGELKGSGRIVQVSPLHYEVREGEGIGDARAAWEEYGTDKHGPHPHMTPAAERGRKRLPANIKRAIKGLL